ncbi:hypothetical protein ACWENS_05660 [Streptomyces sp. NPDC004532]
MNTATKRTIRTVLQGAVSIALFLPEIADASGAVDALPWAAGAVAVAGGFARFMALPPVEKLLDRFGIGLVDDAAAGE